MQEDAKKGKFIFQGEGWRKIEVSSWRSITVTELQKEHTVSLWVPDLRGVGEKGLQFVSPISQVSKCPWKFCRTLRKTSNVSILLKTQRFYRLCISIKLAMQNRFLFINTHKLKMKSLIKWNINQRIFLFNENKFISRSVVSNFYIITHFLSTWKCTTQDPWFREIIQADVSTAYKTHTHTQHQLNTFFVRCTQKNRPYGKDSHFDLWSSPSSIHYRTHSFNKIQ